MTVFSFRHPWTYGLQAIQRNGYFVGVRWVQVCTFHAWIEAEEMRAGELWFLIYGTGRHRNPFQFWISEKHFHQSRKFRAALVSASYGCAIMPGMIQAAIRSVEYFTEKRSESRSSKV